MRCMLALFIMVICGVSEIAYADLPPEGEQALEAASKVLEYQTSLQFESSSTWTLSESMQRHTQAIGDKFTYGLHFADSGGQFRADAVIPDVRKGGASTIISARNATHYQLFQAGDRTLTRSTQPRLTNSSFAPNPALMPFLFTLSTGGELSFKSVRDPRTWESLSKIARWAGSRDVDGYTCDIMEFLEKRADGEVVLRVFFARDAGGYPVRTEAYLPDGQLAGIIETKKYKVFEVQGGCIVVPLSVKVTDYDKSGGFLHSFDHQVSEESIKVNQPVEPELFTIPLSMAKVVVDADTGISANLDAPLERALDGQIGLPPAVVATPPGQVEATDRGSDAIGNANDDAHSKSSNAHGLIGSGGTMTYVLSGVGMLAVALLVAWLGYRRSCRRRQANG